jgi:hypothetical protein
MAHIIAWIILILGFILVVDSFTVIQASFGGDTVSAGFFNFFEFIIGAIFIGIGVKVIKMIK